MPVDRDYSAIMQNIFYDVRHIVDRCLFSNFDIINSAVCGYLREMEHQNLIEDFQCNLHEYVSRGELNIDIEILFKDRRYPSRLTYNIMRDSRNSRPTNGPCSLEEEFFERVKQADQESLPSTS